jgi:hypothetical protein
VKGINSNRASCPSGFTMAFFHARGEFKKSLNAKPGAVDVKDFRPINLVSGVYNIITEVLANRLRKDC